MYPVLTETEVLLQYLQYAATGPEPKTSEYAQRRRVLFIRDSYLYFHAAYV
jgi:hypothetical protein